MTFPQFIERATGAVAWFPVLLTLMLAPLILYWALEPLPVDVRYVAPYFVSQPVATREQAEQRAVLAVEGGTTVYRYIEYCVVRSFEGTIRRTWINEAVAWSAPDIPASLGRRVGCSATNVGVVTPVVATSRDFEFIQVMEVPINPLRTVRMQYPTLPLRILGGGRGG